MKVVSGKWGQVEHDLERQGDDFGLRPEGSGDH